MPSRKYKKDLVEYEYIGYNDLEKGQASGKMQLKAKNYNIMLNN